MMDSIGSCPGRARNGESNSSWRGDDMGYSGRHIRVRRIRGAATSCYNRELGLRDCSSQVFDWSQLHGSDGLDPLLDYWPLCRSCHNAYDGTGPDVTQPSTQGSKHYSAKLTEAIVLECRRRHFVGGEFQKDLAREFDVNGSTMHEAILGVTWKHVSMPEQLRDERAGSKDDRDPRQAAAAA